MRNYKKILILLFLILASTLSIGTVNADEIDDSYIYSDDLLNTESSLQLDASESCIRENKKYALLVILRDEYGDEIPNKEIMVEYNGKTYIDYSPFIKLIPIPNYGKQSFKISFTGDEYYKPTSIIHTHNFKAKDVYKVSDTGVDVKNSKFKKYGHTYKKVKMYEQKFHFDGTKSKKYLGTETVQVSAHTYKLFDQFTFRTNSNLFKPTGTIKSWYDGSNKLLVKATVKPYKLSSITIFKAQLIDKGDYIQIGLYSFGAGWDYMTKKTTKNVMSLYPNLKKNLKNTKL